MKWITMTGDTSLLHPLFKKNVPAGGTKDAGRDRCKAILIQRKQTDWLAAVELTENLRQLDKKDPCKYDLALFGMGALEKFG